MQQLQARSAAESKTTNIVLIMADDLGWNDLTFNGGGVAGGTVPTPNIDSIARQGVNLSNGYAANGTCTPSRAAQHQGFKESLLMASGLYLTDYYTEQAVEVIEANRDRPFLLYIAHWAPHTPLQALKDNGLEDNTLGMFTSDNGGAGYIGLPDVNKPFRGWKISMFEGGIHVPFTGRTNGLTSLLFLVPLRKYR